MRTLLLPLILASAIIGVRAQTPAPKLKPPCCRAVPASGNHTDRSLYQLESKWTSDLGKEIRLGTLRGRPLVLALFFTHCEFACPIIVQDMKRIEAALPDELKDGVDFVLVSLDTERDSVEVLHAYRKKQRLPMANWALLRGSHDDVRELAALRGVNYRKDQRGQFAHSNLITVLNPEGEIVHQKQGLKQKVDDTIQALQKAAAAAGSKEASADQR